MVFFPKSGTDGQFKQEGRGLRFLSEELSFLKSGEREIIMAQRRRQLHVFVVDDEEVIASTLRMILLQGGFRARSFTKPLEALEAARLETPELLISDVVMPELSGIELAIQVREHCPNCKILLFSGQASTTYLLETASANGHNFEVLLKPIHPTELLARIQNLVEPLSSLRPLRSCNPDAEELQS
jgi:DNA-binding response OmpR family regulator